MLLDVFELVFLDIRVSITRMQKIQVSNRSLVACPLFVVHVGWNFMERVPRLFNHPSRRPAGSTALVMYRYLVTVRPAEEVPPQLSLRVGTYAQYCLSFEPSRMQSDIYTSDRTSRPQYPVW